MFFFFKIFILGISRNIWFLSCETLKLVNLIIQKLCLKFWLLILFSNMFHGFWHLNCYNINVDIVFQNQWFTKKTVQNWQNLAFYWCTFYGLKAYLSCEALKLLQQKKCTGISLIKCTLSYDKIKYNTFFLNISHTQKVFPNFRRI